MTSKENGTYSNEESPRIFVNELITQKKKGKLNVYFTASMANNETQFTKCSEKRN